ncbi:hypothetical protein [Brevibacillus aydinogluensis]|uniref:HNH endonuclease n=1 Tax=Brevibacillus aydinogluensis TaxID=927786 RepID=A0AA48RH22_9BACL|nr:hypothetical protein [Brevibacillus aydinogluensis]CAJ1002315.1 hypothetical protein BSPP4475_08310 [Brevibacillus aydinogluensis]
MYNRVDRYDPYVRAAIFYEYDGICFHDKKPLNFREMELDHIIPKKLFEKGNEKELHKLLSRLNLPVDFHRDCLCNLVPSRRVNNNEKGGSLYPDSILLNMLKITKEKTPNIIKRIDL